MGCTAEPAVPEKAAGLLSSNSVAPLSYTYPLDPTVSVFGSVIVGYTLILLSLACLALRIV